MYDTSFRVVQLMYSLLLSFKQSVPNLVVGVQNCLFDDHTVYDVCNVHDKFQGCTVDVQADTGFLTISTLPCYSCTNFLLRILHFMHCR